MSAGATADTATQPQRSDQLRGASLTHTTQMLKIKEICTMEKLLLKFMRAKYDKAVKAGKVRGQVAEYINYGDWKLEFNFIDGTVKVVTPTNHSVDSVELFEAVLDAILTGNTTYIDKLVSAVKIADNRGVKIKGADGDLKITDAYFSADGNIVIWVQIYSPEFKKGYRRSSTTVDYNKFISIMNGAGAI